MGSKIVAFLALAMLLVSATTHAQELWTDKSGNIRNVDARALAAGPGGMYLATRDELYRAGSGRDKWESVFALPAGENEIQCLAVSRNTIFLGTRRGLFRSQDHGKSWKNVFRTVLPEKNNINAIEVSAHAARNMMIATERGVFSSEDLGDRWTDISDNLKNKAVRCLALNKECAYAGADDGLYVRKSGEIGWTRVYVIMGDERPSEEGSGAEYAEGAEELYGSGITCVELKDGRVYIALDKKIRYSDDGGKEWRDMPLTGVAGSINHIAAAPKTGKLYCATTKGAFAFDEKEMRWVELYKGMDKISSINRIAFDPDKEGSLWALTEKGLYRMEPNGYVQGQVIDVERSLRSFRIAVDNEPRFEELQKAAIRFADVDPEKIRRWHAESRLRALLPKLSFGADTDRSNNSEIYTSATKDYIVMGPDDVSNGWDASVSWELGDLIWSDDQTNIDVRSRLTTQLRNDVLDDLRRAYFERKRLQFELAYSPPKDIKSRFDKELRVQELTQAIDDLTGNYLSKHTKSAK